MLALMLTAAAAAAQPSKADLAAIDQTIRDNPLPKDLVRKK